jgi:hypothetical protein
VKSLPFWTAKHATQVLHSKLKQAFFRKSGVFGQALISRQFRLMACQVKNDAFANDSSTINLIRFKMYSSTYVLALLNSSLFSYRLLSKSSIARRDDYPKISLYEVKAFPIRKIEFVTPESESVRRLKQLNDKYQMGLASLGEATEICYFSSGKFFGQILSLMGCPDEPLQLPLDVQHHFLAHLAERMIDINKTAQEERRRFLGWLEKELKIHSGKEGKDGIDALNGKMILKNYFGDYQKGDQHVPFETLWEVVQKNRHRLSCSLTTGFQERMREEYKRVFQSSSQ